MPFRRFLLWDLVCATVVVSVFFSIAHYLGEVFDRDAIGGMVRETELIITIVALAAAGIIAFVALRRHRRRLLEQVIDGGPAPRHSEIVRPPEAREAS
jgi:membrane protein DedA with SNARE-associated domain